jgi:hypothetical protein
MSGGRRGSPVSWRLPVLAAVAIAGCGRGEDFTRYIPAEATAREALAAGLEAWKGGAAAGEVEGTKPLVFVTDSYRNPKERLAGYEILGQVPGNVPRCFAVELRFDPPREEKARYVIVGIDPLWVFRMEDYQLLTQWDHHMKDEPAAGGPADGPGTRKP